MRFFQKFIALALYASILLPGSDYRLNAWMKAVEVTSTAFNRTLRRRRSSVENAHLARFLRLMHEFDGDHDFTWRMRRQA